MDDEDETSDKTKKRTLSLFLKKNKDLNLIFKFMGNISKNIYNTTIYINSIYGKYKEVIYENILKKHMFF